MKPNPTTFAILLLLPACSDDRASFGEERTVPARNRPTVFGQSHRDRFGLEDLGKAGGGAGQTAYTAEVPQHWQAGEPAQFRDLRWFVDGDPTAECYLTAQVGGSLAENVRRWCVQQFGLPPLSEAEIAALPSHPLLGGPALLVELHGTFQGRAGTKMLLLARHEGGMLLSTFRMTAPKAVADRERENFLKVAASVRAGAGGAASTSGALPGPPAPPADDVHGAPPGGATGARAPFASTIPAAWKPMGDTGSRLLRHRFGSSGECYVGQLGGEVGPMAGIWFTEMGQQAPDAAALAALPKVPMLGSDAVLIDLRGPYSSTFGEPIAEARLLVAIVDTGSGIVFAKCLGPAADVEAQRADFLQFCAALKRSDG
jgi:hypothetical protein